MLHRSQSIDKIIDFFFCEDEQNNENEVYVWRLDCISRVRVRTLRTERYLYLMGTRSLDKQVVCICVCRAWPSPSSCIIYGWSVLAIYTLSLSLSVRDADVKSSHIVNLFLLLLFLLVFDEME